MDTEGVNSKDDGGRYVGEKKGGRGIEQRKERQRGGGKREEGREAGLSSVTYQLPFLSLGRLYILLPSMIMSSVYSCF